MKEEEAPNGVTQVVSYYEDKYITNWKYQMNWKFFLNIFFIKINKITQQFFENKFISIWKKNPLIIIPQYLETKIDHLH